MKRRKPADERRTAFLRIRLTKEQRELVEAAAEEAGITLSAWAVMAVVKAAREQRK